MRFYDEPIAFDMPAPRICSGARFLPVSFAIPKEDIFTVGDGAKSMALHFYLHSSSSQFTVICFDIEHVNLFLSYSHPSLA